MVYNAADDVLVDALTAAGHLKYRTSATTVFTLGGLQICGDTDYADENDNFRLIRDPGNNALLDVFVNNTSAIPTYQVPLAAVTPDQHLRRRRLQHPDGGQFQRSDHGTQWNYASTRRPLPGIAGAGEDGTGELILTQTGGDPTPVTFTAPAPSRGRHRRHHRSQRHPVDLLHGMTPVLDNVPAVNGNRQRHARGKCHQLSQGPGGGIFGAD